MVIVSGFMVDFLVRNARLLLSSRKAEEDEGSMKMVYVLIASLIFFAIIGYIIIKKIRGFG